MIKGDEVGILRKVESRLAILGWGHQRFWLSI